MLDGRVIHDGNVELAVIVAIEEGDAAATHGFHKIAALRRRAWDGRESCLRSNVVKVHGSRGGRDGDSLATLALGAGRRQEKGRELTKKEEGRKGTEDEDTVLSHARLPACRPRTSLLRLALLRRFFIPRGAEVVASPSLRL